MTIPEKNNHKKNKLKKNWKEATEYQQNNNIDTFYYTVPDQRGKGKSLKTLWSKQIYLKTEHKFPSIHRKSKVIETWEKMVSPIDGAIEAISVKTKKLISVIEKINVETDIKMNLKILTLNLQGIIDAAVSGGTKLYIEEFFLKEPTYIKLYPEEKLNASKFIDAINYQQKILEEGLNILKNNSKGYEALYTHLNEMHLKTSSENKKIFVNV